MSGDAKKGPNKRALIAVGMVGAVAALIMFSGDDAPAPTAPAQPTKAVDTSFDQLNNISLKDRDAALTQFAKRFEVMEQKLQLQESAAATKAKQMDDRLTSQEHALKKEIAALSNELITLRTTGIESTYQQVNKIDRGVTPKPAEFPDKLPDFPSVPFDFGAANGMPSTGTTNIGALPPAAAPSKPASPYGPNYFILTPPDVQAAEQKGGQKGALRSGGDAISASEAELFASMNQPAPRTQVQPAPATIQPPAAQPVSQLQPAPIPRPTHKVVEIPAFSWVEVTTLHGVQCPIGANAPGVESEIPARPVVLPVRGIFRGPNGAAVDVGNIHLMGLCSGRRTSDSKAGRALVRVEQLSYWDPSGKAGMSAATGYIVDTMDNDLDIYGRIDKASGRTLAYQAFSASAAAIAAGVSEAEFTTQNTLSENGSSNIRQLTGSETKNAVAQGIAELFRQIGNRFAAEANAAIDTVVVEPGIRVRFVTDQPILLNMPTEPFESGSPDILL